MKLGARSVKLITVLTCLLLCIHAIEKTGYPLNDQQKVVVHVDSHLSEQAQKAITHFVKEKNKAKKATFYDMSQLLVNAFPCIESVNIERNASGFVYYSINSVKPIIGINQYWALADQGKLLFKYCFADYLMNHLHVLNVPSGAISDTLCQVASNLSVDLLMAYDVFWVSDQEVYIQDKSQPHFSLLCSAQSFPDLKQLERCNVIKNELIADGSFDEKKIKSISGNWIADMRFKNQVIVSVDHGGQRYG